MQRCGSGLHRLTRDDTGGQPCAAAEVILSGLTETPQTNPELMLKTKSVWSPINQKADGLRILVTRFRGRGMPTSRYNVWMPSLGPSERLLKAGQAGRIS